MKVRWNIKTSVSLGMLILGILWLKVALSMTSAGIGDSSIWGTGATVPTFLLIVWIVLSASVLITDLIEANKAIVKETGEQAEHKKGVLSLLGLIGLLFAYVFVIDHVGYLISTIILLILAMLLFGEKRKLLIVIVPIVLSVLLYLVFTYALKIQLPVLGG